ncbi:cell division protein FtsQ [Aquicoccus porphyridii]|uniref:Cell division protein FtsQ n=1 Tax=Aquicoccus porphyridii TaxID=1852029 RepID=A0A5A9ZCG2_9RHOB|nr:cell division protein FtsQ/DivIB [Aquicoccus porphyridii]KAA0914645.1 cell division protein FtsQ [Aquicoccus porphyridii]RAI53263.1 cell division protein FtsQ [Rhodobacteraceae bacterium AsT-22]
MQPMTGEKRVSKPDPAPSRWAYRFQRLMLTPVFRNLLRFGVPFGLCLLAGLIYLSDEGRRDAIRLAIADIRTEIYTRPEFTVQLMAVDGASDGVSEDIREIVPYDFPVSSFDLDLETIRQDVAGLAGVKSASVRIRNGGVLQIDVVERQPVALWRDADGLYRVDIEGVVLDDVAHRAAYPELPLLAGTGADRHLQEAMAIYAASGPLAPRLRGLVRKGERRWDVVLDRGQRILLPEHAPVQALERVIALSDAQDMLARDLVAVDMRLAERPTLRMSQNAVENWWEIRSISVENDGS